MNSLDDLLDEFYENMVDIQDTSINTAMYLESKRLLFTEAKAQIEQYIEQKVVEVQITLLEKLMEQVEYVGNIDDYALPDKQGIIYTECLEEELDRLKTLKSELNKKKGK